LRSFTTSFYQAPGRLNLIDLDGVKVVIDYAHNPHGLKSLGEFVERMTAGEGSHSWSANLRLAVVATAGDRRDEDMREMGRVAARYFDDVIIREDRHTRGRDRGATAALVLEGVQEARRAGARAGHVEVIPDELEATKRALDRSRPGDLVVLCVDYATEAFKEVETRRSLAAPKVLLAAEGDGQFLAVGGDPDFIRRSPETGL
jgi:cyanophycin synthetase